MPTVTIRGAREHNLRGVDVDLPRDRLIVFCGVSGSGKSSLAFDTLFVEGQRRYLEAVSHGRARGPMLAPPRVDAIDGLPPTLALPQRPGLFGRYATVGSVAEVDPVLRVLLARAGTQHCPRCGRPIGCATHDEIVGALLALPEGERLTIEAPIADPSPATIDEVQRAGFSRLRIGDDVVRIDELDRKRLDGAASVRIVVDRIRLEPDRRSRIDDSVRLAVRAGRGVVIAVCPAFDGGERAFVDRPVCVHDGTVLPALEPGLLSPYTTAGACWTCEASGVANGAPCAACGGSRLSEAARAVRWRGRTLPELVALPIAALARFLATEDDADGAVESVALPELARRLAQLEALALGDLHLCDAVDALSGSQIQRTRLARQVGTGLSGMLIVLDEPVAGLSPQLVQVVLGVLRSLVDAGNTVVAVEHAPDVIRAADHVVEFGPGAGAEGGRIVYQGSVSGLLAADTATGRWLSGRAAIAPRERTSTREVQVSGRWLHDRQRIGPSVSLGRGGTLVGITGPPASGKSTLITVLAAALSGSTPDGAEVHGTDGLTRPIVAERAAAKAARSMPATYVGLWDVLRELLASTRDASLRGLGAASFSLAGPGGRCEACKGTGARVIELGPLPEIVQSCPVCDGRRFQRDVLEVRWKGLDPAELLALSAQEAHPILSGHPRIEDALRALIRVGLGYVPLGQPLHTLSGGEARLLALARELARASRRGAADTVILLDDPTVGLHPADVARLVDLLRALSDDGATAWLATVDPLLLGAVDQTVSLAVDACG